MLTSVLFPLPLSLFPPPTSLVSPPSSIGLLGGIVVVQWLMTRYLTSLSTQQQPPSSTSTRPNSSIKSPTVTTITPTAPSTIQATEPSMLIRQLPNLFSGLTFSFGLLLTSMYSPPVVLGFLHLPSPTKLGFNPSLLLIVIFGILPNMYHYFTHLSQTGEKPLISWEKWRVPNRRDVDWKLVAGSVVFGAGWGLGGVCPGPWLVGIGEGLRRGLIDGGGWGMLKGVGIFGVGMISGMGLGRRI